MKKTILGNEKSEVVEEVPKVEKVVEEFPEEVAEVRNETDEVPKEIEEVSTKVEEVPEIVENEHKLKLASNPNQQILLSANSINRA